MTPIEGDLFISLAAIEAVINAMLLAHPNPNAVLQQLPRCEDTAIAALREKKFPEFGLKRIQELIAVFRAKLDQAPRELH